MKIAVSLGFAMMVVGCAATTQGSRSSFEEDAPAVSADAQTMADGATDSSTDASTTTDAGAVDVATDTSPEAATTAECTVGDTRHCYSGPPRTEGVGQCHGATQVCYRGVDGDGHWPSPIDCVTEVTPYPFGDTAHDGIDNDCNGLVDDDQRLLAGHVPTCYADRGCYWFGNAPDNPWPSIYGFQGCFTSGSFRRLDGEIRPGMLIASGGPDELHRVYYVGRNGRRYIFPTATTFATWFLDATSTAPIRTDAHACASVIQVSDAQLAALQIGGNITFRPGTVATGITTDPRRYVISFGGVLRPLANEALLFEVQPPWLTERVVMTMDAFFVNYSVGAEITNPSTYSWASEIGVTLDQNLGLAP